MKQFSGYVTQFSKFVSRCTDGRTKPATDWIKLALDGQPSRDLTRIVSLKERRADGIFFTGSTLATIVAQRATRDLSRECVLTDPACGAGDLLVACARSLPRNKRLDSTLAKWGTHLRGFDIHSEFVRLTRLRLALLALQLGAKRSRMRETEIASLLLSIRVQDGLQAGADIKASTHIVTNPPFAFVRVPVDCRWSSGSANCAALFMDVITEHAEPATRVFAILPDVLRSGTRYASWRKLIAGRLKAIKTDIIGRFSATADVDVFLLEGVKKSARPKTTPWSLATAPAPARSDVRVVGDHFSVQVGTVIPHRHKKRGPHVPYLTARNCKPWTTLERFSEYRSFQGALFRPPFVVVRRTSGPRDVDRAVGTLVLGDHQVAVENHLLVVRPRSSTRSDCDELLRLLKQKSTTDWLNQRIRCRHLTVSAIKYLPWKTEVP